MDPSGPPSNITSGISGLSLGQPAPASNDRAKAGTPKKKVAPVADSWEDEEDSSGSDIDPGPSLTFEEKAGVQPPPLVPGSPTYGPPTHDPPVTSSSSHAATTPADSSSDPIRGGASSPGPIKRPEKTDAVARRMIAGALGMRMPKQTEEQRAYDRAVREKERKRREEERERERLSHGEVEKAKKAIWED